MLEFERGSTRSLCVENLVWKVLWTCRKADYVMNEFLFRLLRLDHKACADSQ